MTETRSLLAEAGFDPFSTTPDRLAELIKSTARFSKIVAESGMTPA